MAQSAFPTVSLAEPNRIGRDAIEALTNNTAFPTEFKEIRKEWKQRKKAQEASRKQQDDVAHGDGQTATPAESQTGHDTQQSYGTSRNLPPLPYNPASFPNAPQFSNSSSAEGYSSNYVTGNQGYPTSPYAQSHQAVYSTGELPVTV